MTKEMALKNLYEAKDTPTKLMWQNVYFWFIRNQAPTKTDKQTEV